MNEELLHEIIVYIPSIIAAYVIGFLILLNSKYMKVYRKLGISFALLATWLLVQFFAQIYGKSLMSLNLIRIASILSIWLSIFGAGFIYDYVEFKRKKIMIYLPFLFAVLYIILTFMNYTIQVAWGEPRGIVVKTTTFVYQVSIGFVGVNLFIPLSLLFKKVIKKGINNTTRDFVLLIAIVQMLTSSIIGTIWFGTSAAAQMFVTYSFLLFSILIFLGVTKYKLFDIKLAAMRTVGYMLTILSMAILYIAIAYGLSLLFFGGKTTNEVSLSYINIIISLILALVFQPIKKFFDKFTNKVFYHGEYNQEIFYREFGKILAYDTNLNLLLNESAKYLEDNLKADNVFFYIPDKGVYYKNNGNSPVYINKNDVEKITHYYEKNKNEVALLFKKYENNNEIEQLFNKYNSEVIMPLMIKNQLVGMIFIGEHKSKGFSVRDLRALDSISNETAIAIQNSLSVEEIRDLNENLQRKINAATRELRFKNKQLKKLDEVKDEFMSIASHQLRTPLTSIKGYLDMILDGDLGEITEQQDKALNEAYNSSERMVQLINDFLNVSRLQTGKFVIDKRPMDIVELVEEELNLMQIMAQQKGLTLIPKINHKIKAINADVDKLRQVIVNFIDNAIYYSKPNGKIEIELTKSKKDSVIFKVIDNGIGVPESEKEGLFGKFYRASNAQKKRPDGTGVGLFLAKKVIDGHNGKIIFESHEGAGSIFGFEIPIDKK